MDKSYLIELVTIDDCKDWGFKSAASRDEVHEKVIKKFQKYRTDQTPFIEIQIVNASGEKQSVPTQVTLKLSPDWKGKIIEYIESLV